MSLEARIAGLDWPRIMADLDARGVAATGPLLDADACARLQGLYPQDAVFRSHIIMARHGFGRGEYKYYAAAERRRASSALPAVGGRRQPLGHGLEER